MIICCGEALIDMLPRELAEGGTGYLPATGGAVFNTAIALGRLGMPTGFFSGLSNDMFGAQLRDYLEKSNVDHSFCIRSDNPTTLAFVKLTFGHAEYAFFDNESAGRMLLEDNLPTFPDTVRALQFGAISLIPEPCGSAYESLMRRERDRCVIALDPNIRPGFIANRDVHLARMNRMIAMSDIVKLSDEDARWFDAARSFEDLAADWLTRGPKLIIMTRGSEGAIGVTQNFQVAAETPKVDVIDTVGAGDTFNAGLLTALDAGGFLTKDRLADISPTVLREALAFASKTAAITVSRAGANPPWAEEL